MAIHQSVIIFVFALIAIATAAQLQAPFKQCTCKLKEIRFFFI